MAEQREKELRILTRFIEVFCAAHHEGGQGKLCNECTDLLEYAKNRLEKCPFEPKPKCKDCSVHCYKPEYREKIKKVMRFSGIYFVKRGRIDWLVKYFI